MTQTIDTRIVLRNDTADAWEAVKDTATLMEGEMGVETDTGLFKIGKQKRDESGNLLFEADGVTPSLYTWGELDYGNKMPEIPEVDLSTVTNNVKEATTLAGLGVGTVVGDVGIVKTPLFTGADEYTYTGYVWNGTAWAAMDGNYSTENVFIPVDIELAGDFGSYKDSRGDTIKVTQIGNKKIGDKFSAGTSIQDIFKDILSKTIQPTKTNPSLTITASGSDGNKEVGDTYTKPTATLTFSSGSYTYGYKDAEGTIQKTGTGVTFPTAKIAFGADDTITTEGQYTAYAADPENDKPNLTSSDSLKIEASSYAKNDTTATYLDSKVSYTFSANASHTAGEKAIDNLNGISSPLVQIAATDKITATDKTVEFRGYRKMFFGTSDAVNSLDSAAIRGLSFKQTSDGKTYNGAKASTTQYGITLPAGATNLIIACPTNGMSKNYTLKEVLMFSAGVWDTYTDKFNPNAPQTISVSGSVAGANNQNYNVYVWKFAPLGGDTNFKITLK